MKTTSLLSSRFLALATALLAFVPGRAGAQNLYVANASGSTVSEYNASTGAPVSNPFISSGLSTPFGLALANNILYATDHADGTVSAYNATTGAPAAGFTTINTGERSTPWDVLVSGGILYVSTYGGGSLTAYNAATGTPAPGFTTVSTNILLAGLAISGTTLYVCDTVNSAVRTYDARTGALLNANFLTGLADPIFLTVSGTSLYVSEEQGGNRVRAFNTVTGAAAPGFTTITGLNSPTGVKVVGNDLLVANSDSNNISKYNAATGALLDANFITGLSNPYGIAVPEPGAWALLAVGAGALVLALRRRVRSASHA